MFTRRQKLSGNSFWNARSFGVGSLKIFANCLKLRNCLFFQSTYRHCWIVFAWSTAFLNSTTHLNAWRHFSWKSPIKWWQRRKLTYTKECQEYGIMKGKKTFNQLLFLQITTKFDATDLLEQLLCGAKLSSVAFASNLVELGKQNLSLLIPLFPPTLHYLKR